KRPADRARRMSGRRARKADRRIRFGGFAERFRERRIPFALSRDPFADRRIRFRGSAGRTATAQANLRMPKGLSGVRKPLRSHRLILSAKRASLLTLQSFEGELKPPAEGWYLSALN